MKIGTTQKNAVLRTLLYLKPYWHLILLSTICGIAKLTLPMILPQVIRYFTDVLLVAENPMSIQQKIEEIIKWFIILILLYFVVYVPVAYFRQSTATEVGNRIMNTMRCQLFEHMQKMSARFHQENKSGSLVTRINSDVEQVHTFVWNIAINIWIDGIVTVIYIVLLAKINVPMTITACIVLPASVLATKRINSNIRRNSHKALSELSDISGYMQERMSGFAVVKLFGMEEYENRKFNGISNQIYCYNKKANNYFSLGEAVTGSFSLLISVIILGMAAVNIVNGKMTIGELIVFNTYLGYFITPIRRFAELNIAYAKSIAGIERVYEILDMKPDITDKSDAIAFQKSDKMQLEFANVCFKYDTNNEINILDNISFGINSGEKVALVGSSGCGKSTVINLIARFYNIDSGRIELAGRSIYDYTLQSIYENIGIVFQDTVLFSGTIEENIRYGKLDASREELIAAAKSANAYEFIENLPDKWDTLLGERGVGLSGGQKQRLSIARVFLKNPSLLILDEATSALDSEAERLVQQALDNLMKNRTSIVIAHRLSTVCNADKIIVMEAGKIVETGTHDDLLKKGGRYKELYDMQFEDIVSR